MPSFGQALLKPSEKLPSSNPPVRCRDCGGGRRKEPVLISKYNMQEHCKHELDLHNDKERAQELEKHAVSEEEKRKVVDLLRSI